MGIRGMGEERKQKGLGSRETHQNKRGLLFERVMVGLTTRRFYHVSSTETMAGYITRRNFQDTVHEYVPGRKTRSRNNKPCKTKN